MENPHSLLITGASSGIGEALALDYAAPGVTLFLSGRDGERLVAVCDACREKGAEVEGRVIDVTDEAAMRGWIGDVDDRAPLDLVIANAGIAKNFHRDIDLARHTAEVFAVNVDGVFHTIHPALMRMQRRGAGQIAVMASLAGYRGMASAPGYSASKACVKAYGEALRGAYGRDGIRINVICPGFVTSRITERNSFPMPFLMPADRAARIIRRGLARDKARISFPWQLTLLLGGLIRFLPERVLDRLFRSLPEKSTKPEKST